MKAMKGLFTSRRGMKIAVIAAAMAVSVSASAAWWRAPEAVLIVHHYDANGALVGFEGHGACGFPLQGTIGVSSTQTWYTCGQEDVPAPF